MQPPPSPSGIRYSTAVAAAEAILARQAAVHRLASFVELCDAEARERWWFRLCAIDFLARVYQSVKCLYAPLAWLVERSRTVREFYEAYYDGMEWID